LSRLDAHDVTSLQVLRAVTAALIVDRGAGVVGQLQIVAIRRAVEAYQPRPDVDKGDRAVQIVARAVTVCGMAVTDIADNLDRTREEFASRLRDINADHIATLQAINRILAALIEQAGALVVAHRGPLFAATALV